MTFLPRSRPSPGDAVPVVSPVRVSVIHRAPWLFAATMAASLLIAAFAGLAVGMLAALETGYAAEHWTEAVQAHGRLQLFGWVGVFVLALSFEFVVRFLGRPPLPLGARTAVLAAVAGGSVLGAAGQLWYDQAGWLWAAGQLLVLAGALGALALIAGARGVGRLLDGMDHLWFVAGAAWFTAAAAGAAATAVFGDLRVADLEESRFAIEVLLRGFVLNIVIGVALRAFTGHLGTRPVSVSRTKLVFAGLNVATVCWAAGSGAWFLPDVEAMRFAGDVLLAMTLLVYMGWIGIFAIRPRSTRGERYRLLVPVAWAGAVTYALLLAGAVAVSPWWEPTIYQEGAIRHTFMLGFMAPLMLAMAHVVLARFGTGRIRHENLLTTAFVLVTVAAPLRVVPALVSQSPGDLARGLMGSAAVLAIIGLSMGALVAADTAREMRDRLRQQSQGRSGATVRATGLPISRS